MQGDSPDTGNRDPARVGRRELTWAVGVSVGLTVAWLALLPHAQNAGGDAAYYVRMAAHPKALGHSPYMYRVLTPWLAHAVGGQSHFLVAFRVLTGGSLAAAGPAVYLICRRLGGAHRPALVGMAGLMSLPGWLFNLYQPYLIDATAMSLTAWSMVAVIYGWFLPLPLLLTATGLARETVIGLVVPMYMWLRRRWLDWGTGVRVLLAISPALLAVWVVKVRPTQGYPTQGALIKGAVMAVYHQRIMTNPGWWLLYAFAASLGVWWVFGLYGRRHGGRLWWLLVPVFAQFAVGGDWGRFAMYAFPVVVPAGAIAIWRHPRRPVLLALAAAQSVAVFADLIASGVLGVNTGSPSMWISVSLAALAVPVLWWPDRKAPQGEPTAPLGEAAGVSTFALNDKSWS
jgi:hypothetical protein